MAGNIGGPISKVIAGTALQFGTSPGAAAYFAELGAGGPKGIEREKDDGKLGGLPGLEGLPKLGEDTADTAAEGGGAIPGLGLLDDIAAPAWRYGAPVVAAIPRSVKAGALGLGALYGGAKYLEATEPFRGQPAPEPKARAAH
jgi:hypothetical protein